MSLLDVGSTHYPKHTGCESPPPHRTSNLPCLFPFDVFLLRAHVWRFPQYGRTAATVASTIAIGTAILIALTNVLEAAPIAIIGVGQPSPPGVVNAPRSGMDQVSRCCVGVGRDDFNNLHCLAAVSYRLLPQECTCRTNSVSIQSSVTANRFYGWSH